MSAKTAALTLLPVERLQDEQQLSIFRNCFLSAGGWQHSCSLSMAYRSIGPSCRRSLSLLGLQACVAKSGMMYDAHDGDVRICISHETEGSTTRLQTPRSYFDHDLTAKNRIAHQHTVLRFEHTVLGTYETAAHCSTAGSPNLGVQAVPLRKLFVASAHAGAAQRPMLASNFFSWSSAMRVTVT